ncbi:MAG TPA: hypothetical protein VK986_10330 [Tepidisphaeraceae bacterium]|nr:hypothetical protein [Tepidisphaeraceae bacterium]
MARRRAKDPMWAVRGVHRESDVTLVIETATAVQAECFATKRGVEVVVVGEATEADVAAAKTSGWLWKYTPEPRLTCFGRPVGRLQAAMLVVCGLATVLINLKAQHVPLRLYW